MTSTIDPKLQGLVAFVRQLYGSDGFIPLHAPHFAGNEKKYLLDCIDSTFVSSVGAYVDRFEAMMRELTGACYAIATVNGTAALHMALILAGVGDGDEVITQPLTFIATCNAIAYQRAHPVFVDVDRSTLGLSAGALSSFLEEHAERRNDGFSYNRLTGRCLRACVPMHTFGFPCDIRALRRVCDEWGIVLIEDSAESLGSSVGEQHTGTFGLLGAFSFNGNKTVTSGGGGCIFTNDERLGLLGKHLTTTAKEPHPWAFTHDMIGYNYRMPNINAAVACAQLEQLPNILANKRGTAGKYADFCLQNGLHFIAEQPGNCSNYWLNAVLLEDEMERDAFLQYSNASKVMTRPVWRLMPDLVPFSHCQTGPLQNARWLAERLVNLPSGVRS